jgi:tellurite resistance protein TerC
MLFLDLFVLHRRAHEVSMREAGIWSGIWTGIGLGFGGLLWAWAGSGTAQAYTAGYLIERSLSADNIFMFTAIFSALAIPPRSQHRVLMLGVVGALGMRAAFIAAGISLLEAIHPVIYVFGAVLLVAAVNMLRGSPHDAAEPPRVLRQVSRILPVADRPHGQRFIVRGGGRLLVTPLLLALVAVETADVIFAVDSIPAVLAVTTDPFVVYTSNVFALLGMRAMYFLLAGAASRIRYLRPGLAVILGAVAVKLLLADVWEFPAWSAPAFIAAVLTVVAVLSGRSGRGEHPPGADASRAAAHAPGRRRLAGAPDRHGRPPAGRGVGSQVCAEASRHCGRRTPSR